MGPKNKKVVAKCKVCKKVDEFEIPRAGLDMRKKGTSMVKAFPDLPKERLNQLVTHICPDCQKSSSENLPFA